MPTLVVHGGAGRLDRSAQRVEIDRALERALNAGIDAAGAGALEAAVAAVRVLEDDPLFNAGTGAVLTATGGVELDAGVMVAAGLRTGAVAGVTDFAHPVELARAVLDDGRHVLLSGAGASRFGIERGLTRTDPARLVGAARRHDGSLGGTVGAVCRDDRGGLAVAVSTGGIAGKLPGRVGDSALCGAGFYADLAGAACATGHGEDFVRLAGCRRAVELLEEGMEAQTAATRLIEQLGATVNGLGGIIVVDAEGRPGVAHNAPQMSWAWRTAVSSARWSG